MIRLFLRSDFPLVMLLLKSIFYKYLSPTVYLDSSEILSDVFFPFPLVYVANSVIRATRTNFSQRKLISQIYTYVSRSPTVAYRKTCSEKQLSLNYTPNNVSHDLTERTGRIGKSPLLQVKR